MKKGNYSVNAELAKVSVACQKLSMSRNTLVNTAKACGAFIKMGRSVYIDMPVLTSYIRSFSV